ncbi:MAG: mevalonate kinase, partial [Haloferacaceae archaeon]
FNHGLLSALGVSARTLDHMVWAAREAGAHGAKLTGAGGGGCIVALDPTEATRTALSYAPECDESFRAELATEGVRVEGDGPTRDGEWQRGVDREATGTREGGDAPVVDEEGR